MAVGSSDVNGEVVAPVVPTGSVPNALQGAAAADVKAEPTGATVEPKYMTEDQVRDLLLKQNEEFERKLQSRTDKVDARVQKQVQAKLAEVEASLKMLGDMGQTITPEIRERIRQKVVVDTIAQGEEEPKNLTPSPSPQGGRGGQEAPEPAVHPVLEQSFAIIRGMGLDPQALSDEAAALIDQETKDEKVFLASVRKAAAFEYARVNEAGAAALSTTNGNGVPAARVAGFGSVGPRRGNPIENINDPNELFRQAFANGKL